MSLPQVAHRLTESEYLVLERAAEFKSEFFDGEMFAMAGGTALHSLITANLTAEFGNRLQRSECVAYSSDLRVKVEENGLYTYPDLSVVCGPIQLMEGTNDTLVNPTVLVEVLSESTEGYDRGKKFELYRQIPSLREYVLVSQRDPRIESFQKQPSGQWVLNEAAGLEAKLALPSLGIVISLANVFAKVAFAPGPIRPPVKKR